MADEEIDELGRALTSSSTLSSSSSSSSSSQEPRPTTLLDVPNDVLVRIFQLTPDPLWISRTFPLVCRAWRDLFYTRDASPLHAVFYVNLRVHRAPAVLAWAEAHAADVRALVIAGPSRGVPVREFTERQLTRLISRVGPHLEELVVGTGSAGLQRSLFWATLRDVVMPAGRLKNLQIDGIHDSLTVGFAASLGRLTSLTRLKLTCDWRNALERGGPAGAEWGLPGFPESVCALRNLDALSLDGNRRIFGLPDGISNLRRLRVLSLSFCSLLSFPAALGALSRLTLLSAGKNENLGTAPEAEAFPAALGRMKSLRVLDLPCCRLRVVPSFVGSLTSLKKLNLMSNGIGRAGAPNHGFPASFPRLSALTRVVLSQCNLPAVPPAVLSSMPALKQLYVNENLLRELPRDLGRCLPQLEHIDLAHNCFTSVPVAALAGATALKKIILFGNEALRVEQPLDGLVENHPRLRLVKVGKRSAWSRSSGQHLAVFAVKLGARNPDAPRRLFEAQSPEDAGSESESEPEPDSDSDSDAD